eukprot:7387235-Prymnesium_polylepis.1
MPPSPPHPPSAPPPPPLGPGDCMVITFNSDSPKGFEVLLLAPLGVGQEITVTDDGWRTDITPGAFGNYDQSSHLTHTATETQPAGSVLT